MVRSASVRSRLARRLLGGGFALVVVAGATGLGCKRQRPADFQPMPTAADVPPVVAADPEPEPVEPLDPDPYPAPPAPSPAPAPRVAPAEPDFDGGTTLRTGGEAGTLNGDPKGPKAAEMTAALNAALPRMQRCFDVPAVPDGKDVVAQIGYTVEASGHAREITVSGAPPSVGDCLKKTLEGVSFPAFSGESVSGTVPLKFRRDPR